MPRGACVQSGSRVSGHVLLKYLRVYIYTMSKDTIKKFNKKKDSCLGFTMHAENLHTEYAENFNGYRNMKLFSEGGIAPSGECWVAPTAMFLRVWESPAGNRLKKQGFRLRNNGKQIGASQDRILVCPRQKE